MLKKLKQQIGANSLVWVLVLALILYCFGIYMIMPKGQSDLLPGEWKQLNSEHQVFFMLVVYADSNPPDMSTYLSFLSDRELADGHRLIKLSLTSKPKWKAHFYQSQSIPIIREKINEMNKPWLKASYQLPDGRWLNYSKSERWTYFHYAFAFLLLMFLLGLITIYASISGLHASSLGNIKRSAQRLGVDMYSSLDASKGTPLLQDTLGVLKSMQQRIQILVNRNSQITAAIAHDLRTPITRVRLSLEFFDAGEHEHKITKNLSEMENMISELINFSKSSTYKEPKSLINLNSILLSNCYSFQDVGKSIEFNGLDAYAPMVGTKQGFQRCFNNVINNAFKFGDHVDVSSKVEGHKVTITIADNGPGIPEEEIEKVLQPFYRTEFGRESGKSGSGLGLAIVSEVVAYHNGAVRLYNRPEGGLAVEMGFELAMNRSLDP